jgi:FlaA1/EpsC-like NDP-sugar epimerase
MGDPIRIYDLARMMIELSGLKVRDEENPQGNIAIEVIGLRSGEKLYEELFLTDSPKPTRHEKIMRAEEPQVSPALLERALGELEKAFRAREPARALQAMAIVVEDFRAVQAAS